MAICCILLISAIFFGDLWIKNRIEGDAAHGIPDSVCKNHILIRKYHNTGAMLNLGQNRHRFIAAVSVALCILMTILFLLTLGKRGNHLLRIGLSLLLGGSFSNTYDRLKRKYVVDYFSFRVKGPLGRVIFNISDFCILIGALLVVLGTN